MDEKKITRKFFILFFLAAGTTTFFTPPFQVSDAQSHFNRALQVSLFQFRGVNHNGVSGGVLPNTVTLLESEFAQLQGPWRTYNIDQKWLRHLNVDRVVKANRYPINAPRVFLPAAGVNSYLPLLYVPAAAGLLIARLLSLSLLGGYYFAALCNLLLFTVLATLSISKLPRPLGWFFAAIYFCPISLQLAGSINPAGLILAFVGVISASVYELRSMKTDGGMR